MEGHTFVYCIKNTIDMQKRDCYNGRDIDRYFHFLLTEGYMTKPVIDTHIEDNTRFSRHRIGSLSDKSTRFSQYYCFHRDTANCYKEII